MSPHFSKCHELDNLLFLASAFRRFFSGCNDTETDTSKTSLDFDVATISELSHAKNQIAAIKNHLSSCLLQSFDLLLQRFPWAQCLLTWVLFDRRSFATLWFRSTLPRACTHAYACDSKPHVVMHKYRVSVLSGQPMSRTCSIDRRLDYGVPCISIFSNCSSSSSLLTCGRT